MKWLAFTPTCVVVASLAMVPRLDAEESIAAANRVALGSGSMSEADAKAVSAQWSTAANAGKPVERKANPGALTAMGFAVRKIPKKRAQPAT